MATAEEYFTHLLQSYGSFKGGDPASRREVAAKVVEFLDAERAFVDFTPAPAEVGAPTADQIQAAIDEMTYAPEEAEVALD